MLSTATFNFIVSFDSDTGKWVGMVEEVPRIVRKGVSRDDVLDQLRLAMDAAFETAQ